MRASSCRSSTWEGSKREEVFLFAFPLSRISCGAPHRHLRERAGLCPLACLAFCKCSMRTLFCQEAARSGKQRPAVLSGGHSRTRQAISTTSTAPRNYLISIPRTPLSTPLTPGPAPASLNGSTNRPVFSRQIPRYSSLSACSSSSNPDTLAASDKSDACCALSVGRIDAGESDECGDVRTDEICYPIERESCKISGAPQPRYGSASRQG